MTQKDERRLLKWLHTPSTISSTWEITRTRLLQISRHVVRKALHASGLLYKNSIQ